MGGRSQAKSSRFIGGRRGRGRSAGPMGGAGTGLEVYDDCSEAA